MTAEGCVLAADVFSVCLTHALSTEREEIMGLLIGELDKRSVVHISALVILQRSDKTPDRCEISPEQLTDAAMYADSLQQKLKRPMRVLGWYHSHPHITVWPSHVDVRTQADYQMMDPCFVGVIFSVFNIDKQTQESQVQVTCFQSVTNLQGAHEYMRREVPFFVQKRSTFEPHNLQSLSSMPQVLLTEETLAYKSTIPTEKDEKNLVTQLYNASVYSASVCHVMDTMIGPLMSSLTNRLTENKESTKKLIEEKKRLQEQIDAINKANTDGS
ncbi:lys-63-specific deubiquitinase BRCC36-like [Watersipora subatra]|uniref:lys-63-specific deubiquitinase BRCC36-like n=1 Tax=Watersipora subatra TaxID=2589382 RepID=UPI00355B60AC